MSWIKRHITRNGEELWQVGNGNRNLLVTDEQLIAIAIEATERARELEIN